MIRRLTSKEDGKKKKKRNQIVVSVILAGIMLFSTLAYSFGANPGQQETTVTYNGYDFTYLNGLWNLNLGANVFSFANNPNAAYKVESDVKLLIDYSAKPLYFYSENLDAESEIYRNLYPIVRAIGDVCPAENSSCGENLPVKTCSDNFIIIKNSTVVKVEQKDGCVFIEGPAQDLTKIADGFVLKVIGVQ